MEGPVALRLPQQVRAVVLERRQQLFLDAALLRPEVTGARETCMNVFIYVVLRLRRGEVLVIDRMYIYRGVGGGGGSLFFNKSRNRTNNLPALEAGLRGD